VTRVERLVGDFLRGRDQFASAQQIHALLREQGERAGLSSVYRALRALEQAGEVDALANEAGETLFRRCAADQHHHHLRCTRCGVSVDVAAPAVERWAERAAREAGFTLDHHTVELSGRCGKCARVP